MTTLEEQTQRLADYLPGGKAFGAKNIIGSVARSLLTGLAKTAMDTDDLIDLFKTDIVPDTTTLFIDEWERAVGIPEPQPTCFDGTGSVDDRRVAVLVKLASLGVQTAAEFKAVAAVFGVNVQVIAGLDASPAPAEMTVPRFTIVIQFTVEDAERWPWTWPHAWGSSAMVVLECLFAKLRPANCVVIFEQV
jgi:uncharacterized protein YmfQ (DUF2313 family)